eukprot:1180473-Prorocentrum_minimum.AAC.4
MPSRAALPVTRARGLHRTRHLRRRPPAAKRARSDEGRSPPTTVPLLVPPHPHTLEKSARTVRSVGRESWSATHPVGGGQHDELRCLLVGHHVPHTVRAEQQRPHVPVRHAALPAAVTPPRNARLLRVENPNLRSGGYGVDVKGSYVDVKGYSVDVKGYGVEGSGAPGRARGTRRTPR